MKHAVCSFEVTLIHMALLRRLHQLIKVKNQVVIGAKGSVFMEDH